MNTDTDQTIPKRQSGEGDSDTETGLRHGTDLQTSTAQFHGFDVSLHPDTAAFEGLNGDEIARLTFRVRELEHVVENQNREILRGETQERNYRACLEDLARYKTECSVLETDRDRHYNERTFYQLQAEELTAENNKLRERIHEKNNLLLETERIKVQQTVQIEELQKQIRSLTERYADGTDSLPETERRSEKQTHVTLASGIKSETIPKRRRFSTTKNDQPVCKNCNTVFCHLKPVDVDCTFHIAPPQPYEVWKSNLVDAVTSGVTKLGKSYKFWPCCEQVSIKEPPGCRRLRRHDLIQ